MVKKAPRTDLQAFFEEVGSHTYSSKEDRYHDFRAVFLGDSTAEQGKRVLSSIIAEAEGIPVDVIDVEKTHEVSFRMGKRSLGLWIVQRLNDPGRPDIRVERTKDA